MDKVLRYLIAAKVAKERPCIQFFTLVKVGLKRKYGINELLTLNWLHPPTAYWSEQEHPTFHTTAHIKLKNK